MVVGEYCAELEEHAEMADEKDFKQRVVEIERGLRDVSTSLIEIKNNLKWHAGIGWAIAGLLASAFVGTLVFLMTWYIPHEIDDRIPANFSHDFGEMQQKLNDIDSRLNRLTPSALDQLIPYPDSKEPARQTALNLTRASHIIDVAVRSRLPGSPAQLSYLFDRVSELRRQQPPHSDLRQSADSLAVRLSGYSAASDKLINGIGPVKSESEAKSLTGSFFAASFTAGCDYPTARAFGFGGSGSADTPPDLDLAEKSTIFDVAIVTCKQNLDGPRWIQDSFDGSRIIYRGGPLYLASVSFEHCTFDFGNDPNSQLALATIKAAGTAPVSILLIPRMTTDSVPSGN
jgi:hypothetical protein